MMDQDTLFMGHGAKIVLADGSHLLVTARGARGVSLLEPRMQTAEICVEHLGPDRENRVAFDSISDLTAAGRAPADGGPVSSHEDIFPRGFEETVRKALPGLDPAALELVQNSFRGTFLSAHDFLTNLIGEHLPAHLQWLLSLIDPDVLRQGYERGRVMIWTISLCDGRCYVFETPCSAAERERPIASVRPTVF